jgi:predicted Rossmann-fold nucleotide-binding protein
MGAKQMMEQETPAVAVPYVEKKEKKEKLMMTSGASKRFKKLCVFCGSSSGKKGVFSNEALNLGRELV